MKPLNKEDIRKQLKAYICNTILQDANYPLGDDEPLLTGGLIDSFYFIQIALFIEETFGVHIPDDELTVENMDTVSLIIDRVVSGAE